MPLNPDAKIANIEGSLRQYVNTKLATTFSSGVAIDYGGGEPFDDTAYSEWLQVRLLDPARPTSMMGPRVGALITAEPYFGREMFHMLNLNIFVRPAKLSTANSLRLQTLRDTVMGFFMPVQQIAVLDYADASASLGNLVVDTIAADRSIRASAPGGENELLQWNIVLSLRWTESWARW